MKSTWYGDRIRKDFGQCLLEASGYGKHSLWDVFSDFLELAYTANAQAVETLRTGQQNAGLESRYMTAVSRYEKTVKRMGDALGLLVLALEEKRYDFLGTFAGESGLLDGSWKGQFFTPPELCHVMVSMTMGSLKPDPSHRITIQEPACGAGAMAIAACVQLQQQGFYPWNYWIDCQDVDYRMFQACYIQLTLCGFPGVVRCGNTLTLEQREARVTLAGAMHPLRDSQRTREVSPHPNATVTLSTDPPPKPEKRRRINPYV